MDIIQATSDQEFAHEMNAMKKSIFILVLLSFVVDTTFAQVIAQYIGSGGTSTAVTAVNPNVTVTPLSAVGFGSNTPCGSGGISGLTANGITVYAPTNPRVYFKITPNAGYQINITGYSAALRRSGSGISKVRYAYSLDNGATWINDLTDHAPNNGGCNAATTSLWGVGALPTGISSTTNGVLIALYPYAPIASGGVIQINNIIINGTVTTGCTLPTAFTVTGGGSYCAGGTGVAIGLSGSQTATTYQLYNGATTVGAPVAGTGSSISFGLQTAAGTYTVLATGATPGCTAAMTGSAVITINPLPSPITGVMTVCEGSTTTLFTPSVGGTWSSSATGIATIGSSSGVVNGILAGTARITYTTSFGCIGTVLVTVNPSPAAISGTAVVCSGFTTTLTDPTPGGTWSSSNTAVGTVDILGMVTGIAAGNTTISYTLPAGCPATLVVTINQTPPTITGITSVCAGVTTTLGNAVAGGTWLSSTPSVATIGSLSGTVTSGVAGTAVISYVLPTSCMTASIFTVNALPSPITGSTALCTGLSATLSNSIGGGVWSSSNTSVATIGSLSGFVNGIATGTSSITYTLTGSCTATVIVTVDPAPPAISGPSVVCRTANITLTNPVVGGVWSSSNATIVYIGTNTGLVTGFAPGTATISYTTPNCNAVTHVVTVLPLEPNMGTPNVCIGSSTTLTNSVAGGTWVSSDPSVATVSGGVVTSVAVGTTAVSYVLPTGCQWVTVVTVNPQPPAIVGAHLVCVGLTTPLLNGVGGGTWSSSAPGVAMPTPTTGVVTGVFPGTATITYTIGGGCYATFSMTVGMAPSPIGGTPVVCTGDTMNLSNALLGGTWSSSDPTVAIVGSSTGKVVGMMTGTVTISYNTASCNPVLYIMTVNQSPATITGITNVCVGSNTTLSNATPGGVWSSSSPIATISPTGEVIGLSAGTNAIITYTLPSTGCFTTAQVIVDSLPAPIAGTDSVCQGWTVTLTDVTHGGVWSSSNGVIASAIAATGVVSGVAPGTVTITYSLVTGCNVTMPFRVIQPLSASVHMTASRSLELLCAGTPVTFTAHGVNGGTPTFQWQLFGDDIDTATGETYTCTPTHGDFLTLYMISGNICSAPYPAMDTMPINVYPVIAPDITISTMSSGTLKYLGEVITFYSEVTHAGDTVNYQWYKDGAAVAGATNSSYATEVYDNDAVYCKVSGNPVCATGITGTSNTITIYGDYLGTHSLSAANSDMSLFPDPNTGNFTISGTLSNNTENEVVVEVADMLGHIVYNRPAAVKNSKINEQITLGNVAAGSYIVRLHSGSSNEVFHIVVSK